MSDLPVELGAMPFLCGRAASSASFSDTNVSFGFFLCHNITKPKSTDGFIIICQIKREKNRKVKKKLVLLDLLLG
jgi:hypothetical protein